MLYRQLGKTNLKVSLIGLGTEHLKKVPPKEVEQIFRVALKRRVNYVDLVWSFPNIVNGLSEVLKQEQVKPVIAFHFGSCISNGKYKRSRNPDECERHLRKLLDLFNMDYAPVLNVHYVANLKVWKEINRKGILSAVKKLKEQGLARVISVSTHEPEVINLAAKSGVDSIMHQVNVANHMYRERNEALLNCEKLGIGVVAMKPFAGGELLKAGKKVKIAAYKTGWKTVTMQVPKELTSTQLLSYTLSQPGVCTAVTGVSCLDELVYNLTYFNASKKEMDYSQIISNLQTQIT